MFSVLLAQKIVGGVYGERVGIRNKQCIVQSILSAMKEKSHCKYSFCRTDSKSSSHRKGLHLQSNLEILKLNLVLCSLQNVKNPYALTPRDMEADLNFF